jgi:hypothetical protein
MNLLAHNIVQEHDDLAEVIKARAEVALGAQGDCLTKCASKFWRQRCGIFRIPNLRSRLGNSDTTHTETELFDFAGQGTIF